MLNTVMQPKSATQRKLSNMMMPGSKKKFNLYLSVTFITTHIILSLPAILNFIFVLPTTRA